MGQMLFSARATERKFHKKEAKNLNDLKRTFLLIFFFFVYSYIPAHFLFFPVFKRCFSIRGPLSPACGLNRIDRLPFHVAG